MQHRAYSAVRRAARVATACWLLVAFGVTLLGGPAAPVGAAPTPGAAGAPAAAALTFPETSFTVAGAFARFWEAHGGLRRFGYPLGPAVRDPASDGLLVQYFERARFEYHPENPATYQVEPTLLGAAALGDRPERAAPPVACAGACDRYPETRHTLRGVFRDYWATYGGLAVFGYPLTEEFSETSAIDGRTYTVQYFERARFEEHPENAGTSYEVLLGQLGRAALARRPDLAGLPAIAVPDGPDATNPRRGKVIVLDPGHDRTTGGAEGIEYRDTLRTALAIQAKLEAAGYTVALTRPDDATVLLGDPALAPPDAAGDDAGYVEGYIHASTILALRPDLAISIHYNAAPSGSGGGSTTYYCDRGGQQNARLAGLVQREIAAALADRGYTPPASAAAEDGGIGKVYGHLATLGNVNDPSGRWVANRMLGLPIVLTEALFETNPTERALIADDATLARLADGYRRAIDAYFGY
ncbi:MAG TPA: N-acetylmuramoyl-L-alanine amidase [Thermomicrobiales bacterium]|nr:N-acetylmuramoyl-L-alanine amidase [Thermomicrobiales bacterium]